MDILDLLSRYRPHWSPSTYIIIAVILIAFFCVLLWLIPRKHWRQYRVISAYLLLIYLILVYASTVFTRDQTPEVQYYLEPFWSYRWGIDVYGIEMIRETILNTLMLVPIGLLLPLVNPFHLCEERKAACITITAGFLCSCSIELLQLVMRCGLFEFDDMFHNTLGVVIGYGVYKAGMIIKRSET